MIGLGMLFEDSRVGTLTQDQLLNLWSTKMLSNTFFNQGPEDRDDPYSPRGGWLNILEPKGFWPDPNEEAANPEAFSNEFRYGVEYIVY